MGASEVIHQDILDSLVPELDIRVPVDPVEFIPNIHSGSFADIGPRRSMEDEHICIDDLSIQLGKCPKPSAFYAVFDGHGGSEAAAYLKEHAIRFMFKDVEFPQSLQADKDFSESVEEAVRESFRLADLALAEECTVSSSTGTTALTALVFGRLLLVANAGDCRAVLCRNGKALEMSQDHRPTYDAERQRIERSGGYVDDGYLNGVLSVARALGDWELKKSAGSPSPLISEPEFRHAMLTKDDEFLIIGCDGIWDVMSSHYAVSIVRRGLRRHGNPERCARELVWEALRLNSFDNLTVIVVCFSEEQYSCLRERSLKAHRSISAEAFSSLQNWLDN